MEELEVNKIKRDDSKPNLSEVEISVLRELEAEEMLKGSRGLICQFLLNLFSLLSVVNELSPNGTLMDILNRIASEKVVRVKQVIR